MICKYGDKVEKFHIILWGKIEVVVPLEKKGYVTYENYIDYLVKLQEYKERELLLRCIELNKDDYPVTLEYIESLGGSKESSRRSDLLELNKKVKLDDYITRVLPILENFSNIDNNNVYSEIKEISYFQYQSRSILETGEKFGENGIMNNNKRYYSLIT